MARKKRRSSPRKVKRSTVLNPSEITAEVEEKIIVFVNSQDFPMNPDLGFPSHRSDVHYTGVALRAT